MIAPQCGVLAKNAEERIKVSYKDIKVYAEDEQLILTDALGNVVEPFIYEGTTYLPLRAVAEALSMEVGWDGKKYIVDLKTGAKESEKKDLLYTPFIGEKNINISYRDISVVLDGEELELKTADGKSAEPFIYEGTTYLPLRAVAEATKTEVEWDGDANSIYLKSSKEPAEEVSRESSYDLTSQSDWTKEEAENYGYLLDFESRAEDGQVVLLSYTGEEKDIFVPSKIDGKTVYINLNDDHKLFMDNTSLEYVSFEDGVYIANVSNLFIRCTNLKAVYNLAPVSGGNSIFSGCSNLQYADIDSEKINSMSQIYANCPLIKSAPVIGTLVSNLSNAFLNCESLEGDVYCKSVKVENASGMFKGTKNPINLYVPYPSKSYETFEAAELPDNVTLVKEENRIAFLPENIYVASFATVDLYNYAVAPGYEDCDFIWKCETGTASDGKFSITGEEENVGEYPISVTISRGGEELYTAHSTVNIVSNKKASKSMSLVSVGDAYTVRKEWRERVLRYIQRVRFVGTRSSSHEGRTGASLEYYLKDFKYTSDKNGVGEINPFFNPQTQKFDWEYYKKYSSLSPSAIQFFFQTFGSGTEYDNLESIKTMVSAVRETAPDTKIFIVIPANLKSWGDSTVLKNFEYAKLLDEEFSDMENVYLVPLNLTYNRDNHSSNKSLPDEEGYNQWGRTFYSVYTAALQ